MLTKLFLLAAAWPAHALPLRNSSRSCAPTDNQDDCEALVALFKATGSVLPWADGTPLCHWQDLGHNDPVACDTKTQRVAVVYLSNSGDKPAGIRSGFIPTEIGKLTGLRTLGLYNTSLTGTLPTEVGQLTSLESMFLGDNSLAGSIPTEFGKLTKLQSMTIPNAGLSGVIPTEIGLMKSLVELIIPENELSGVVPDELCELISSQKTSWADCSIQANHFECPLPACAKQGQTPVAACQSVFCK